MKLKVVKTTTVTGAIPSSRIISHPVSKLVVSPHAPAYITFLYLCPYHNRCENGGTIYLKEGYWANTTNNTLVTYVCPYKYCNCTRAPGDLPGCLYDPDNINGQCSKNRSGWLCGKCSGNTSVGLRYK